MCHCQNRTTKSDPVVWHLSGFPSNCTSHTYYVSNKLIGSASYSEHTCQVWFLKASSVEEHVTMRYDAASKQIVWNTIRQMNRQLIAHCTAETLISYCSLARDKMFINKSRNIAAPPTPHSCRNTADEHPGRSVSKAHVCTDVFLFVFQHQWAHHTWQIPLRLRLSQNRFVHISLGQSGWLTRINQHVCTKEASRGTKVIERLLFCDQMPSLKFEGEKAVKFGLFFKTFQGRFQNKHFAATSRVQWPTSLGDQAFGFSSELVSREAPSNCIMWKARELSSRMKPTISYEKTISSRTKRMTSWRIKNPVVREIRAHCNALVQLQQGVTPARHCSRESLHNFWLSCPRPTVKIRRTSRSEGEHAIVLHYRENSTSAVQWLQVHKREVYSEPLEMQRSRRMWRCIRRVLLHNHNDRCPWAVLGDIAFRNAKGTPSLESRLMFGLGQIYRMHDPVVLETICQKVPPAVYTSALTIVHRVGALLFCSDNHGSVWLRCQQVSLHRSRHSHVRVSARLPPLQWRAGLWGGGRRKQLWCVIFSRLRISFK